jgi:hypothetical protein
MVIRRVVATVLAGFALGGIALAHPGGNSADVSAAESAAFTEADADGDGKLTLAEFESFHDILRQKLDALAFADLDTDGDGALSQAEVAAGRPGGRGPRRLGRGL